VQVRDRLLLTAAAIGLTAGVCAGCATAQPHAEPELPPLAAPVPPPRLLPPLAGGPIDGATPTPPPEGGQPATPARRREPRAVENPRQEPKPADAPRAEVLPDPQRPPEDASPQEPARVLQLETASESDAAEQTIRQQLLQASRDLQHVDYIALSADAKAQYDTAKRFAVLAERAIKDRNFVFARTLADKAAVIAAVLSSR
jgi:hypothetical protein